MGGLAMFRGLRHLFSVYPHGLPGAGLLLLRLGMGAVLTLGPVPAGYITTAGGALLAAGFLTPLVALAVAGSLAARLYGPTPPLPELSLLLLIGGCVAVALLGPGAYSLDARLFGRREIVIPRRP
jgi:uncharacterized membrane protein YphA (DoxX/SURF4 family)